MTTYNTGNPIGSTDARDLYDNAQNLDNFANGSAASYTDRSGVSRRSLSGIDAAADNVLNGIGYAVPVAYASGISLTLTSQTVDYNGVIYAPKSSALPFTTSSWVADSAKFRAIQVTDADLITYTPAGTGAVATTVQSKLREFVSVKDFGAVGDGVADDAPEIQAALDYAETIGACEVRLTKQFYRCDTGLRIPDGVTLVGRGTGAWDTVYPNRAKTWEGTTLLFKGTGAKTRTVRGISSAQTGGGARVNPDDAGETFKLSSFTNSNASGTTPATLKTLSVAITGKNTVSRHWGVKHLRLAPWIDVDGYTKYSDTTFTGLADDWSIGLLLQDSEYVTIENVQAVGYWREYGFAMINPDWDEFGGQERNRVTNCKFQGLVGMALRSGDQWAVTATTSSTVTIPWADDQYWPESGTFTGLPAPTFQVYTYTSTSRVGGTLVFNGVSPDPTIAGLTAVRSPKRSSGAAGSYFLDVLASGLDHTNGGQAGTYGLGASKALEVSGFPMRGLQFFNCKWQTREKVVAFFHDCQDVLMSQCQFEGSGFLVASPIASGSSAPNPVGDTRNLRWCSTEISNSDRRLFTPRSIVADFQQFNSGGLNGDFNIRPFNASQPVTLSNQAGTEIARFANNGDVGVGTSSPQNRLHISTTSFAPFRLERTGSTGVVAAQYKNDAGTITLNVAPSGANSGVFRPDGDNAITLGGASNRWSVVYAGTGTINTSDAREKQQVREITEAEQAVAKRLKKLLRAFKFNDAVAGKGDAARIHFGVIAQDVKSAFETEGLVAENYSILCYDEWPDVFEPVYARRLVKQVVQTEDGPAEVEVEEEYDTGERVQTQHAGNRYGVRYEELLAFIIAAI